MAKGDVKQQTNIFHCPLTIFHIHEKQLGNVAKMAGKSIGNPLQIHSSIHLSNFGQVFTNLLLRFSFGVKIDDNLSKVFPGAKKSQKIRCFRRLFQIFPFALWQSQTFEQNYGKSLLDFLFLNFLPTLIYFFLKYRRKSK